MLKIRPISIMITAKQSILIYLLSVEFFGGCTAKYADTVSEISSPEQWRNAPDDLSFSSPETLPEWWKGFQDNTLNDLIKLAFANNQDIKIARSRVLEAQAMVTVWESSLYPSIDLSASGGQLRSLNTVYGVPAANGLGLIMPVANFISGGLTARWEPDIFGGRHLDAAAANELATGITAELHAVQVGLAAQLATNYLELRGLQERMVIQQNLLELSHAKLRALQNFYAAGLVKESDVNGQLALLRSAESALIILKGSASTLIHRIAILTGQPPVESSLKLEMGNQNVGMPEIPNFLPANLLSQRPDLSMAKTQLDVAAAKLGVAQADLYPRLILSLSGGVGSLAVAGFPSLADSIYTLGSGLTAPIFNAGRIEAQIKAADARLEQAGANYEKTFLWAMEDVENAFVSYRTARQQLQLFTDAEGSAAKKAEQTEILYQNGSGDYPALLETKQSKLNISGEKSKALTALRIAVVSLYRAFGGGWTKDAM